MAAWACCTKIKIEEMYTFRVRKDRGIELWNTKSAADLVQNYQQMTFK